MGFLSFLARRSNHDGSFERASTIQPSASLTTTSLHDSQLSNTTRRAPIDALQNAVQSNGISERKGQSFVAKPFFLGLRPAAQGSDFRVFPLRSHSSLSKLHHSGESNAKSSTNLAPSIKTSRSIMSSTLSGHVDLLDAHGEIKPCDFRSRVQATGTRDYGEDVAERNIGENGVDVQSPAAKAFYNEQKRMSMQTLSNFDYRRHADSSTMGGSEAGESSRFDDSKEPSKPQPRREVSGIIAGRPSGHRSKGWDVRSTSSISTARSNSRLTHGDYLGSSMSHRKHHQRSVSGSDSIHNQQATRNWISGQRSASISTRQSRPESRQSENGIHSRPISPPCVPRYRPGSTMPVMQEEEDEAPYSDAKSTKARNRRPAAADRVLMRSGSDAGSGRKRNNFRDHFRHGALTDGEISEYDAPHNLSRPESRQQNGASSAPPQTQLEWQNVVQRAVEESLSRMPLSTDLRALLELSQKNEPLEEYLGKVPSRHSSWMRGSITSTPSTDVSEYASSSGRPHSRHTTTTSVDSTARLELYQKSIHERKSPSIINMDDQEPIAGAASPVEPHMTPETGRLSKGKGKLQKNIYYDVYEAPMPDHSDVDSFTEKRRQMMAEDEPSLFEDSGYRDVGSLLPGIVNEGELSSCATCSVLSTFRGEPAPSVSCEHSGAMTRRQRLQALGYDYDTDEESDTEPERVAFRGRARAPKAAVGSGGRMRRLTLRDDCIEEDSEEESGDGVRPVPQLELRRKNRFSIQSTRSTRSTRRTLRNEHEEGNAADIEYQGKRTIR